MSIHAVAFASIDGNSPNGTSREVLSEFLVGTLQISTQTKEKPLFDFPVFIYNSTLLKHAETTLKKLLPSIAELEFVL